MKRVLVTGAGGFIGEETLPLLLEAGFEVHALSRDPRAPGLPGVAWHRCDVLDDDVEPLLRDVAATHLLHLAWYAKPGLFWTAPENLDWVAASLRLARGFARSGGRRLVGAGSCAEYDWSVPHLDERETPLRPSTLYGEAKASTFRLLEAAAPVLGLSFAWGRVFFPFGPREKPDRLLSSLFDGIASDEPIEFSAGTQQRDFMHVEDVAAAFVRLLASEAAGPVNIARGETLAVREIVARAARLAGGEHLIRFGARPMQAGEPPMMSAATRRLREELGFSPRYTIEAGLEDMHRRRQREGKGTD
jgi:nucleoside-diphosphate-sugar epimerase